MFTHTATLVFTGVEKSYLILLFIDNYKWFLLSTSACGLDIFSFLKTDDVVDVTAPILEPETENNNVNTDTLLNYLNPNCCVLYWPAPYLFRKTGKNLYAEGYFILDFNVCRPRFKMIDCF